MKKHLTILLLLACVTIQAQNWMGKVDWKRTGINMGIALASVTLEMTGDALYDMGKETGDVNQMRWGHTIQACGYGVLVATIPLLYPRPKDIGVLSLNYLAIRYTFGDAIYNSVRGLPLLYAGTTSTHDNILSKMPPDGRAFTKVISFGFAIGININHW